MINLHKVTLLTIDGIGKNSDKVKTLFEICSKEVSFADKKILTSDKTFQSYDDVKVIYIDSLNYKQYNKFCIRELTNYVDTEYVLLVQNDGFISNSSKWTDEFLNYDYIGSPWESDTNPNRFPWTNRGTINMVGCGGFSLRSKKLLNLCRSEYEEEFVNNQILGGMHEDIFICVYARPNLEEKGCKFPDVNLANQFAKGSKPCSENITQTCFGFHESTGYLQDALNNYNKKYKANYTKEDLY
jgi:hypothetical protein